MRWLLLSMMAACAAAQEISTVQVAALASPTDIQNAGDGTGRLFLVQQNGLIRILKNGSLVATPFLDIRSKTTADGERGLLGLAFPPDFAQSQRFYVDYTDLNGNTVVAQYRFTSNPDVADASSEIALLHVTQPFANHNGGQIRFGPDGYLYIALGDGRSAGDPMGNGQNLGTLLGKLLRVDVEGTPGQLRIPPTNPFVNTAGARGEIWAYGLRNPWRFTFDRANHDLWIGDVGQDAWEEVDLQPAASHGGENYGWNRMEGNHCYGPYRGPAAHLRASLPHDSTAVAFDPFAHLRRHQVRRYRRWPDLEYRGLRRGRRRVRQSRRRQGERAVRYLARRPHQARLQHRAPPGERGAHSVHTRLQRVSRRRNSSDVADQR